MSEHLAGAAAALNAPEELVERSARARAAASGMSVDEVLAAWSGGGTVAPAAAPEAGPATDPEPAAEAPVSTADAPVPAETAPAPAPAVAAPAAAVVVAAPMRDAAPILEAKRQSGVGLIAAILGLLILGAVVGFILPASAGGDDTHIVQNADLSALEEQGREVYIEQGCGYCHTQLVRPVLADVSLGPVTETNSLSISDPPTHGIQRIGPDLSHLRNREEVADAEWVEEFLRHPSEVREDSLQPSYGHLSDDDLAAVAAYVVADKFDLPDEES